MVAEVTVFDALKCKVVGRPKEMAAHLFEPPVFQQADVTEYLRVLDHIGFSYARLRGRKTERHSLAPINEALVLDFGSAKAEKRGDVNQSVQMPGKFSPRLLCPG